MSRSYAVHMEMLPQSAFIKCGKRLILFKKDQAAPDYAPMAEASEESARLAAELGREQLDFARQQYDDAKPFYEDIVNQQMDIADKTSAQGDEYYNYLKDTFRPVEQGLVDDANSFSTEAYREQEATKAAADAGTAFSNTQESNARALTSMGVNPNSGRFSGTANRNALAGAALRTGAMNGAREKAEAVGYAKRLDAAGLGRNLTGASQGAYGLAVSSGNSAGQNQMVPGAQMQGAMGQSANTTLQGRSLYQSGLSDIMGTQAGLSGDAMAANASGTGAAIGAAGGIAVAVI